MKRQEKQALRAEMGDRFDRAKATIVAEYRGMTVQELTTLRVNLRRAKGEFKVISNRITKKAVEGLSEEKTDKNVNKHFKGPIGVAFIYGDSAQGTKTVLDYAKDNEKLKVIGGLIGKDLMTVDQLKVIASLPPKEVLLAQIVGLISSPHRGLVTVLSGVTRNLVQVINAIKEKKTN